MKDEFYYVGERAKAPKLKFFVAFGILLVVTFISLLAFTNLFSWIVLKLPFLSTIRNSIISEIQTLSPLGLIYVGFGGGLFFIPLPQELFFIYSVMQGNSIFISFLMVNIGYLLSQGVNYFVGVKFSKIFMHFVSKKKVYKVRRFINKRGGIGVFSFNLFPLPAPLLTFAVGIAKYNVTRLFFYTILGTTLKYVAIMGFLWIVG